jgi:hypothetical protein
MRTKRTSEGALIVHAVTDRPIGEGSLVEVLLLDSWRAARSERVSANHGDRIKPKQQNGKQGGLANQLAGS